MSDSPSSRPSDKPSALPSLLPTNAPSVVPSASPSDFPSSIPSSKPSLLPSSEPTECVDELGWIVGGNPSNTSQPFAGMTCDELNAIEDIEPWCNAIMKQYNSTYLGKAVNEACCACDGSKFQTIFPSSVPSEKPSISNAPTMENYPSSQPSNQPTECVDEPEWFFVDSGGDRLGCQNLIVNYTIGIDHCERFQDIYFDSKNVNTACCICGGGINVSRAPSTVPSSSQAPSSTPSISSKPSPRPSDIPSNSPTISTQPTEFPSTNGLINDGSPCRYDRECRSGVCIYSDLLKFDRSYADRIPLEIEPSIMPSDISPVPSLTPSVSMKPSLTPTSDNGLRLLQDASPEITTNNLGVCEAGIFERSLKTTDFEFVSNKRYYSKNGTFYLVFELDSGNLVLRNVNGNVEWRAIEENSDILNRPGNTCFFQQSGNLVIFNQSKIPIWSLQPLLEVCQGECFIHESCVPGLKCWDQTTDTFLSDNRRRLSETTMPPSDVPSISPVPSISTAPSMGPSITSIPSESPSESPSGLPSESLFPSTNPSDSPSGLPSVTSTPSTTPTDLPSNKPSYQPSDLPSEFPSMTPVPGCSGPNEGYNVCIVEEYENKPLLGVIDEYNYFFRGENIDLCQGNCVVDDDCIDHLVCTEPVEGKVQGCNGLPNNAWKYCTYPSLRQLDADNDFQSNFGAFLRVEDTGVVSIYSGSKELMWNSVNGTNNQPYSTEEREPEDVSISNAKNMAFAGNYRHIGIIDELSEVLGSGHHANSNSLEIYGTTSIAYELAAPFEVSAKSTLSFDVNLGTDIKALGICPDDGKTARFPGDGRVASFCLMIGGSSPTSVFNTKYVKSLSNDVASQQHFEFRLIDLFPSRTKVKFIGIVQVAKENVVSELKSTIENFNLSDDVGISSRRLNNEVGEPCSEYPCPCPAGQLAVTKRPGIHYKRYDSGDACTNPADVLTEITKNEGEDCDEPNECRSGICGDNFKCASRTIRVREKDYPYKQIDEVGWGVCESGCSSDDDCNGSALTCKKGLQAGSIVPGCLGTSTENKNYCVEENPEQFEIQYSGYYGELHDSTISTAGGGSSSGRGGSFVEHSKITLYGDVWKTYILPESKAYHVTGNTWVSFIFELTEAAEGHAICFDENDNPDTYAGYEKRCIALAGTEFNSWDEAHVHKHVWQYDGDRRIVHVHEKIGHFFYRTSSLINYIAFIQDNDANPFQGVSSFWDIEFYEVQPESVWTFLPGLPPVEVIDGSLQNITLVDSTMSYNGKFQAVIMEECIESDRKESLSRELKEFNPNDVNKTVPFRKVVCFQAGCESMVMHTDLNVTFPFMDDNHEKSGWIGRDCNDCYCGNHDDQRDYRGTIQTTPGNFGNTCECRYWNGDDRDDYPDGGLKNNYCRNPSRNKRAWCYIKRSGVAGGGCRPVQGWKYCDIPDCDENNWKRDYSCPADMLAVYLEHHPHDNKLRKVHCARVNNSSPQGIVVGPNSTDIPSAKYFSSSQYSEGEGECKEGYLVAGIECQDLSDQKGCTHIRLICRRVTFVKERKVEMSLRLYSKSNSWGEETHKEILETDILPIKNEVSDCRTEDPDLELQKDLEGLGFSKSGTDLFFFDKQDTNNVKKYDYHVNADGTLTRKATYETSFRPGNLDAKPSSVTKPNNFGEFVVAVQHSEGNKVAISAPSTDDPENDINKSVGAIAIYNKPANDWNLVGTVYGEENNFKLGEKLLHFETEHDLKVISSKHESSYASDVLTQCPQYAEKQCDESDPEADPDNPPDCDTDCRCKEGYVTVNNNGYLKTVVKGSEYCTLAFFSSHVIHEVDDKGETVLTIAFEQPKEDDKKFNSIKDFNYDSEDYLEYKQKLVGAIEEEGARIRISLSQFSKDSNNPEKIELNFDTNEGIQNVQLHIPIPDDESAPSASPSVSALPSVTPSDTPSSVPSQSPSDDPSAVSEFRTPSPTFIASTISPTSSPVAIAEIPPGNTPEVKFLGLRPGKRYLVSLSLDENIRFPIVTSCSCQSLTSSEQTGRPGELRIEQTNGHVTFIFRDQSKCESGFSFTRFDGFAEFVDDSRQATTFSRDYSFQAPMQCGSIIAPGVAASDDLRTSKLEVGKVYSYCVRSINENGYMDQVVNTQVERSITSSSAFCSTHRVQWESSISGIVTTDLDAGSLPIENVRVSWQLQDESGNDIQCEGCTGEVMTDNGGVFEIPFNIRDSVLYGKNDVEIPVKLFFSKVTTSGTIEIPHRFLCNEGQDICDSANGNKIYLRHLYFDTPLHIYDDTNVPFTGKVTIHGTECPIIGARACPLYKRIFAGNTEALVGPQCVDTDSNGFFIAPVVVGSVIHGVRIEYEEHEFEKTSENKWPYETGVSITEEGFYVRNDFQDVSKARLFVEVAGGLCDLNLGISEIQIRVKGCHEDLQKRGYLGEPKEQNTVRGVYDDVPAHFLEVKVLNVRKNTESKEEIGEVKRYFNGEDPVVRTIDLLNTAEEDDAEDELIVTEDKGSTGTDTSEVKDKSSYRSSEERKETVRFQYDGTLEMKFQVSDESDSYDNENCDADVDTISGRSFHVVQYMSLVPIDMQLRYKILENLYCNYVDPEKHKLSIESNLGMDRNAGFDAFYEKLPSEREKELISICSSIAPPGGEASGPCLISIDSEEEFSGKRKFELVAGRPNISKGVEEPYYSKNVNIRVVGGANNVQHRADFFIEGQFSKGSGDSFAIPTYQPVMILRDPPGGGSTASYNNIRSSVRIYNKHDKTSNDGEVTLALGFVIHPDTDLCTGTAVGGFLASCKETVGGETAKENGNKQEISSTAADSSKTITNSFSTTWSYTTSSDPSIAGEDSDVFVVPNLNVFYTEVFIVSWDQSNPTERGCAAKTDGDSFPSTVVFDIDAPDNKPAFTFYSRHHIKTTKIPEISKGVDSQLGIVERVRRSVQDGEAKDAKICCDQGTGEDIRKGFCLEGFAEDVTMRACKQDDLDQEILDFREIFDAELQWTSILASADATKEKAINESYGNVLNWFKQQEKYQYFNSGENDEDDKERVRMETGKTEYSQLAPQSLTDIMNPLDSETNPLVANKKSAQANRIQFSGASGSYTLTLDRASSTEYSTMACQDPSIRKALDVWSKLIGFGGTLRDKAFQELAQRYSPQGQINNELKQKVKLDDAKQSEQRMAAIEKNTAEIDAKRNEIAKLNFQLEKAEENGDLQQQKELTKQIVQADKDLQEAKDKNSKLRKDAVDSEAKKLKRQNAVEFPDEDDEEPIKRKNAMYEQRQSESDGDKHAPDRKQSYVAEDTGKKQVWKGGGFLENTIKNVGFAFSAGPIVVASMLAGCNFEIKSEAAPADLDLSTTIFGVGVEAGFFGDFQAVITHEATRTDDESEETSVSFELSDPDIDDEFVVDIYYDEFYGTFIFNTVAGRSKCVWEKGTGRSEDPSLRSYNSASSFIYPNEKMVFEVEMNNLGRTGDSFFYVTQEASSRNLDVRIDASRDVDENGHVIQLYRDKPVIKQIIITRGFTVRGEEGYEFPEISLTLKSKCEADMNIRQNTKDGMYVTIPLFNHVDEDGTRKLKWIEPCPKINWIGNLKRDRSFLVNLESLQNNVEGHAHVNVEIYNPFASKGKTMKNAFDNGTLKNVLLRYREKGATSWKDIAQAATPSGTLQDMDFLKPEFGIEEDDFGVASLFWRLDTVPQGNLEIMLETKCEAPSGAPAEVKGFQEEIISGVYDIIRPEQYGTKALPLRNDVLIGEEVVVLFTESIRCSKPYPFRIRVDINGTEYTNLRIGENIQVNCDRNKLGFQLKNLDFTVIAGKNFTVEISRVEDEARNEIALPIKFAKRFADLDSESASTAFRFLTARSNCVQDEIHKETQNIRNEIASKVGLDTSDRIQIHDLACHGENEVIADAEILPESQGRNLKNDGTLSKNSYELVQVLQGTKETMRFVNEGSRSLLKEDSYSVHSIEIIPSARDRELYQSSPEEALEESRLMSYNPDKETADKSETESIHIGNNGGQELITILKNEGEKMEKVEGEMSTLKRQLEKEKEDEISALKRELEKEKEDEARREDERMRRENERMRHEDERMTDLKRELEKEKEEDRRHEDERMAELMRELKESRSEDMKSMFMFQVGMVVLGCVATGLAIYIHFTRARKASDSTNSLV
ncbi:hypothetical protein CTEN210_00027 [Chaetoceros tenuissimus]|uniref:Kringle domain-containing protein n=1 Tax=Chaetoceros tenuissimus TaxID=426638 RepID=A0AAD3CDD0_9STRA|nr:hypothetical protein CTEN210_00027 [Chaetoceros tenuissimus]